MTTYIQSFLSIFFSTEPPPIPGDSLQVVPVVDEPQTVIISFGIPDFVLVDAIIEAFRILATPATAGAGSGSPVELEYIVPFEACPEIRLTGLCPDTYYVITIYTMSGTSLSEPVTTSLTTREYSARGGGNCLKNHQA